MKMTTKDYQQKYFLENQERTCHVPNDDHLYKSTQQTMATKNNKVFHPKGMVIATVLLSLSSFSTASAAAMSSKTRGLRGRGSHKQQVSRDQGEKHSGRGLSSPTSGCQGISSASSAGDLIASIANCSAYHEPWVSFDNSASETACYHAISSYVSNGLPNDLRSYYYTRMSQATTTWQSKLNGMTIGNIPACDKENFDTIKTQLVSEFSSLSELSGWQDSMVDYIKETTKTLKNHLDGVNGIMKLQASDVIPPPSGLPTWAKVFFGVVQLASAAAPGVLESEAAIQAIQGTAAILNQIKTYAEHNGSGSSPQDDNSDESVAYDKLVGTTLPSSFKNMTDAIKDTFTAIAGDYGKLMAFNKLVYLKYATPTEINFADAMGDQSFQDIYEYKAWSMLFPGKYGMCYQYNPYGENTIGSCVANDVPGNMQVSVDDVHFWPCEHSHPNLVPPTQVLDALAGNSFVTQKGLGLHDSSFMGMIPFLLSGGSMDGGIAIAGTALLCNSKAPWIFSVNFKATFGYQANCAELDFAKSMTFTELDECSKYHNSLSDPNQPPGAA